MEPWLGKEIRAHDENIKGRTLSKRSQQSTTSFLSCDGDVSTTVKTGGSKSCRSNTSQGQLPQSTFMLEGAPHNLEMTVISVIKHVNIKCHEGGTSERSDKESKQT